MRAAIAKFVGYGLLTQLANLGMCYPGVSSGTADAVTNDPQVQLAPASDWTVDSGVSTDWASQQSIDYMESKRKN